VRGEGDDRVGPEHFVERTDDTLTYVSPKWWPNNAGGLLVIPTAHFENLYEIPDRLGIPIQAAARRAALALKLAYSCDGVSTRQHNEPAGNQDVWHFHLHVFPRYVGDGLYGSSGDWANRDEMAARADGLRVALSRMDG
jgi:histidine triad (HIT) family protein